MNPLLKLAKGNQQKTIAVQLSKWFGLSSSRQGLKSQSKRPQAVVEVNGKPSLTKQPPVRLHAFGKEAVPEIHRVESLPFS